MKKLTFIFLFISFTLNIPVWSSDQVGDLRLKELLLSPQLKIYEPKQGGFNLQESYFSLLWQKDDVLAATIMIGSSDLIPTPVWYREVQRELALVEAYGEVRTRFGKIGLGLIPIAYGLEGAESEALWIFSPSYFYAEKWLPRRDHGFFYNITSNGFFTTLSVHNGEGGKDLDARMWYTGRWGWSSPEGLLIGFSGVTGRTTPEATLDGGKVGIPFDASAESRVRVGNFFFRAKKNGLSLAGEYHRGEIIQTDKNQFGCGNVDFIARINEISDLEIRFNQTDPNMSISGDKQTKIQGGFAFHDRNRSSVVHVQYARIQEEDVQIQNDELWLVWKLTPLVH